jgi:hypothetical protein
MGFCVIGSWYLGEKSWMIDIDSAKMGMGPHYLLSDSKATKK